MKNAFAVLFALVFVCFQSQAQAPNLAALAKVKTAALVVHATTSIACGDGSEGTCVRNDSEVVSKVKAFTDATELWDHFEKADATKADAILEFTIKDASTTYGRISFSVRDADSNTFLYFESRDVVTLENDIVRIVNHLLKAVEDAKRKSSAVRKR